MNTYVFCVALLTVLALSGCRRGDITNVERGAEGGLTVTVQLSEADVNAAVNEALQATRNPLLRNPVVDLQNGLIVVSGEHVRQNGNGTVSGSINVTLTAQNGALLAQVSNLNIEGLDVADERLTTFNQRLVNGFTVRANRENRQITVNSVVVTSNHIELTITARQA